MLNLINLISNIYPNIDIDFTNHNCVKQLPYPDDSKFMLKLLTSKFIPKIWV